MRFPYVINVNTKLAYDPSQASLDLVRELDRRIYPEELDWGDDRCPSLIWFCVQVISKNFKKYPIFHQLPGAEKDNLLEILSTDLPLQLVIPLIQDEIYWKRRYDDTYGLISRTLYPNWKWKNVFIERYIQQITEEAKGQDKDEEGFGEITKLCCPYVYHLTITELQVWKPPLTLLKDQIPEFYPEDHINFEPILKELVNIEEFDLVFGMNYIAEIFTWRMFRLTVLDCERLGKGILHLENLKILRVHRSKLEDAHCRTLVRSIALNKTLIELDLSYCHIGDQGALCLAKLLLIHPTLEFLILSSNKIGALGGKGFGFALLDERCCPLIQLNLKLNPLGHDGVLGLLRALVRGTNLRQLIISGCYFDDDTPFRVADMINLNSSLEVLDISNNYFGAEAAEILVENLTGNRLIKWLDLRETDIPAQCLSRIKKLLLRNRGKPEEEEEEEDKDLGKEEETVMDVENIEDEEKVEEEENENENED